MCTYTLIQNGDVFERICYPLFIQGEFTSYETFWQNHIVLLTNRPININFKDDAGLTAIGKGHNDICNAQLHYSVLKHLYRTYTLKNQSNLSPDLFIEGIVRLCGAQDVAFELLERCTYPNNYSPWLVTSKRKPFGSKEAHYNWQGHNNYPLQEIRDYRNILLHGRMLPGVIGEKINLPDIGKERLYFDWRLITNNPDLQATVLRDFKTTNQILDYCWNMTIQYFETQWQTII